MNRKTLVVLAVVVAVLIPMWFVALHGEPPSDEIAIDQSVSEMQPLEGLVDTPNKLSPSQVGVIVWIALFALFGALAAAHRFMNRAVRPTSNKDGTSSAHTDGGRVAYPWTDTDDRWVVEYRSAGENIEGLLAMGGLTALAVVFAMLFTGEYFTLARTQYFGLYAGGMFLSLALLTVAYYAWFLPHVKVAEQRGHDS
jgi:hypothetical protein